MLLLGRFFDYSLPLSEEMRDSHLLLISRHHKEQLWTEGVQKRLNELLALCSLDLLCVLHPCRAHVKILEIR
jgi:hypothetical protein